MYGKTPWNQVIFSAVFLATYDKWFPSLERNVLPLYVWLLTHILDQHTGFVHQHQIGNILATQDCVILSRYW